jgi:hypothetical protein
MTAWDGCTYSDATTIEAARVAVQGVADRPVMMVATVSTTHLFSRRQTSVLRWAQKAQLRPASPRMW